MNKNFLIVCALAGVVSFGTFTLLNALWPYKPVEANFPANPTPEEIFGGDVSTTEAAVEVVEPGAAPAAELTDTAAAPEASTEVSTAEAAPAEEAVMPVAEPEAAPVSEPAPEVVAEAAPIAEPAPKPKPKKKKSSTSSSSASTSTKAWWGTPSESALSVIYAGSASFKHAVVLMFNADFTSASSADGNIVVKDANGKKVTGNWEVSSSNPRMLILDVGKPGRYTVNVGTGLAAGNLKTPAKAVSGPVSVK